MTLGVFSIDDRLDDAVLMAAVQGSFYGVNLPAARIEGLIASHVPKRHITEISDVYGSKWWDYRRLSPGHSFFLFAHHYYKAFKIGARRFLAERARSATDKTGRSIHLHGPARVQYDVEDIWERDATHITGMWNAMKMADAMGIPYDQFCALGNRIAIDTMWTRLPSPAQLYGTKLGAKLLDAWETLIESRMFTAHHPLFKLDNYAGLEVQDAYRDWLIASVEKRGDPTTALATIVYRTPQLPEALALQHFPANTVNRARLLAA